MAFFRKKKKQNRDKTDKKATIDFVLNEFNNASAELLKEAQAIISDTTPIPPNLAKIKKLENLGFVSEREGETKKNQEKSVEEATLLIKRIKGHSLKYPKATFITEKKCRNIYEKYELVLGEIKNYSGIVPHEAIRNLEGFKLKEEDFLYAIYTYTPYNANFSFFISPTTYYNHKDYQELKNESDRKEKEKQEREEIIKQNRPIFQRKSINIGDEILPPTYMGVSNRIFMCAPTQQMKDWEKFNGYFMPNSEINANILLIHVEGGYLVISTWGSIKA